MEKPARIPQQHPGGGESCSIDITSHLRARPEDERAESPVRKEAARVGVCVCVCVCVCVSVCDKKLRTPPRPRNEANL